MLQAIIVICVGIPLYQVLWKVINTSIQKSLEKIDQKPLDKYPDL